MAINILGINHKSAPIDIREKLMFDKNSLPLALNDIKKIDGVNGVIVLSTCNRTEIYTENDFDNTKIMQWFANQNMVENFELFTYNHYQDEAIKHLLSVTSGIDSMVIGENEILGQVKQAFKIADKNKVLSSPLKRLFEFSFSVAKQVRTDTDIGSNPVTFMFTAMTLIKKIFDKITDKKATIIGSGHMSQLAIKYLQDQDVRNITLTNHNYEKGKEIANDNNCNYSKIQYLGNLISSSDIIITSTSSTTPIIGKGLMESCIKNSPNLPIIIIDLGVPRDVEPEIYDLDNIYLYTIDDLGKVISNNYKIREQAINEAKKIIDYKILEFKKWIDQNHSNNLIRTYRGYVDNITDGSVIKARKMIESGENVNEVLTYLAESLKNKLTHETTSKMKEILPLLDESAAAKVKDIFKKK
ncbi:MAG: glutamyl-tRNA reductase [Gammaproteobacteria bacterium]|nr:glutamyl-tRNA reductase [Gammaproteobacteria bacterium]